jgi:transcriptional regulator with XRE-family HTH domain
MALANDVLEAVTDLRRARDLTQAELAKRAGTTQSAIARLESGAVSPSLRTVERLLSAMDAAAHIEVHSAGYRVTAEPVPPRVREPPSPTYGDYSASGIDLSQIRESFKLTPHERLVHLEGSVVGLRDLLDSVER